MTSFWNTLGIRARITLGFLPLILLMMLLSVNTMSGVGGIADLFGMYRATAAHSLAVGEMNDALQTMQLSASQYRNRPSAEAADAFKTGVDGILRSGDEATRLAGGDADASGKLRLIHDDVVAYAEAFAEIVALQQSRESLTSKIMDFGPWTTIALADVMRSAWRMRDVDTANQAGLMADLTSQSLLATERFLSSADLAFYEDAKAKIGRASEGTRRLASLVSGSLQTGRMRSIDRLMANYTSRLDDVRRVVVESEGVWTDRLGRIGPALQDKFADLQARIVEQQRDLGPAAETLAASTSRNTVLISVLLIGVGLVLSYVIGRLIAHTVQTMAATMQRIAGGDDADEVAGVEYTHELGAMARALKVFQETGRAKIQAQAEAERTRRSAEDSRLVTEAEKAEESRHMTHAFGELATALNGLAAGDLTVRVGAVDRRYDEIAKRFNEALDSQESVIRSVVAVTGSINSGLQEITTASGDLAQRTETQAASLEETVAALSEVMRGVNNTAQSADDARSAASVALSEAEKGGKVVTDAVAAMSAIEASSEKIGRIIGVIDEIAFQTNLLALNAGVEAARAGEAGRGFAVVAQEVRGLAQRSAEAAREIKDLISTSTAQVGQGVELVTASGRSLQQIVQQVDGVTTLITDMARSAREQAMSLKEVATAADQMDKVTQQNAAMVEETTAAAQNLSGEMQTLTRMTDRFLVRPVGRPAGLSVAAAATSGASLHRSPAPPGATAGPVVQMRATANRALAAKSVADDWAEF